MYAGIGQLKQAFYQNGDKINEAFLDKALVGKGRGHKGTGGINFVSFIYGLFDHPGTDFGCGSMEA